MTVVSGDNSNNSQHKKKTKTKKKPTAEGSNHVGA
jgi:hypothetical protein